MSSSPKRNPRIDVNQLPGIKQADFQKCAKCHKGMGACGSPQFYRVTIESCVFDSGAIDRQIGLEKLVGHHVIAAALSPNEDMAKIISKSEAWLCSECAVKAHVFELLMS